MSRYQLTLDTYKKTILDGFSNLLQEEEFVDMTLAVEGHLVKVHKTLMALASPYLKAVIQSAPCPHPIVFLTHIKHETLALILEYVYTGEVMVPSNNMNEFIETAKALNILGLNNLLPLRDRKNNPKVVNVKKIESRNENETLSDKAASVGKEPASIQTEQISKKRNRISTYNSKYENFINTAAPIVPLTTQPGSSDLQIIDSVEPNMNQIVEYVDETGQEQKNSIQMETDDYIEENNVVDDETDQFGSYSCHNNNTIDNINTEEYCEDVHYDDPKSYSEEKKQSLSNNYSINIEMPSGKKGPPKITIDKGFIENAPNNMLQVDSNDYIVPDTIPKIIINPGSEITQDQPSISISGNTSLADPNKFKEIASKPIYMLSGKGALQVVLNRFIYGVHYHSKKDKRLRWRCIDYRHKRCPAYMDTMDEKIVQRKNIHNHGFHDDKIMQKGLKQLVFETYCEALQVMEVFETATIPCSSCAEKVKCSV